MWRTTTSIESFLEWREREREREREETRFDLIFKMIIFSLSLFTVNDASQIMPTMPPSEFASVFSGLTTNF